MNEKKMTFDQSFWNESIGDFSGWENIVNVIKIGRQNLKTYADALKQRSEIEEMYGKSLLKLAKGIHFERDVTPLSTAWTTFRTKTELTGEAHLNTARELAEEASMVTEVCTKLRDARKNQEQKVRECQLKLKQDHRRATESKRLYENRCSEEILSSQIYHKEMAKHGKSSREAEKAKGKYDRMKQLLDSTESSYKQQIDEAEGTRSKWEVETVESFKTFQALEEDRIQVARESMWKMANIVSTHCVHVDDLAEDLRQSLEGCILSECLQEIVDDNCTGESKPGEIWYESFPNSSHYGLSPAPFPSPALVATKTHISSLATTSPITVTGPSPPKPPRMIHYASTSSSPWPDQRFDRCYPLVDSVDNLEYFTLTDTPATSTSSSNHSDNYSTSSEQNRYPFMYEKKLW